MTIPKHDVPEALLAPRVTQTGRADGAEWDIASTRGCEAAHWNVQTSQKYENHQIAAVV